MMQNIIVERHAVNIEALDAELRSALGDVIAGMSTRPGAIVVHLSDAASKSQANQAQRLVLDHDATQLTSEQSGEVDRIQRLRAARQANRTALEVDGISNNDVDTIKRLARKVAWLEQEIRDLRGDL